MAEYRFTVGGDFSELLRAFDKLDARAAESGRAIGKGIDEGVRGASNRSIAALQAELARLERRQTRVAIDSSAFDKAGVRIREIEGLLQAIERRKITLNADPGSILALRTQLGQLNDELSRTAINSKRFQDLQREIRGVERELRKAGEAGGIAARGMGLMRSALALVGGFSAGAAVTGFFRESISQAIQLETATRRLTNTLGPQGAGAALGFLRSTSDQLGLSFRDLVGSYGRFTAAATAANVPIGQQQELFTAVSRAGMALGLSTDEVNGAFLALQQIASKGTVSMEELRQQLGERLPIALAATAKGLNMSIKDLVKLVETGQLSATKFFPAFTKGLNELTAGAQGAPTAAQNLQRFQNAWEELQVSFGQNLLPTITSAVKQLTAALAELKLQGQGRGLGFEAGIGGISNQAAQVVSELNLAQKKYNLTDQEARNIFSQAKAMSQQQGPLSKSAIAQFLGIDGRATKEDARTIEALLKNIDPLAKKFAAGRRDRVGEANAEASAANALTTKLEEQAKARREALGKTSQQGQIQALEAEAALIQKVTTGKLTQADADRQAGALRLNTLRQEVAGYDALIASLEKARAAGASNEKQILAAQAERAAKVVEIAKAEQAGSQAEVERRRKILELAISRLQVAQTTIDLEDKAGQIALSRLRTQLEIASAISALGQAQQDLVQSQYSVSSARQNYEIRSAEEQLQLMRNRGASTQEIGRQEQYIASLKRGAAHIEFKAMEAQIDGMAQRFVMEQRILKLKQVQQAIEAQSSLRASRQNELQQQQKLLELQSKLMDPSLSPAERGMVGQQVSLQRQAVGLAQQQVQSDVDRINTLGTIFGIERQTLGLQQQATANGLRAQAASKGWEGNLSNSLDRLDSAANSVVGISQGFREITTGIIEAGGASVTLKATIADVGDSTSQAANAASLLSAGYADANTNATALLGTLQRIATTPQARWSGGGVEAGAAYRINELGQESLLTPGGGLSLIHAPARSLWRAPSRGTVLPAGITAALKDSGAFDRGRLPAGGSGEIGKLRQEIRELRSAMMAVARKSWDVNVRTPGNAAVLRAVGGL